MKKEIEAAAKIIFEKMRWAANHNPPGKIPPPWQSGGNSDAQAHAREAAGWILEEKEFFQLRKLNTRRQKEWDTGGKMTPSYMGNEFAGEAGELCNVIKKLERESFGMVGSRATIDNLRDEAADVVICLDNIANFYGIDLWPAVKMKFNKTSRKNGLQTMFPEICEQCGSDKPCDCIPF